MTTDLLNRDTTALAFVGDAVQELYIRKMLFEKDPQKTSRMHKNAVMHVRADGQAKAIKEIFEDLNEDEKALVKRARNRRSTSRPQNAAPLTYKWATAFEALIGYLYLRGDSKRLEEILGKAVGCIVEENQK